MSRFGPVGLLLLVALPACAVHQVKKEPKPLVAMPEAFSAKAGEAAAPLRWWTAFGDASLNGLVDKALTGNFDLKRAVARLGMANAVAAQQGAAVWPQLSAEVGVNASRNNVFVNDQLNFTTTTTTIPLMLTAAYEVDLWGRVSSVRNAARLEVVASAEDRDAMAMMISAQVAETWFALVEQRAGRALLLAQIAQAEQLLELVQLRFGVGQSNVVALLQQRQQVVGLKAQLPLVEGAITTLGHQLALLSGRAPGEASPSPQQAVLPALPALPKAGVPAAVLKRRPDVRAAALRVRGADHRLGAAVADRFPALRLTARTGFQGRDGVGNIFDNWIWNLAANLVAPLVDGGRRAAEVSRGQYAVREALAAYSKAVISAIGEVEDALVRERRQSEHLTVQKERLGLARQTLHEARRRYADGQGDYLSVLTAIQSLQAVERALLGAQRQLLSHRITLYRALGGTWREAGPKEGHVVAKTGAATRSKIAAALVAQDDATPKVNTP